MNFYAIDFETANYARHSACSLAIVKVENSQIVDTFYTLIQPETSFFWKNIQIHGIHPKDVAQAPKFPEVWARIQPYFQENHLIVAHNASFDCSVLSGCLAHYQLTQPTYRSLCTVKTSRALYPSMPNHQLQTVCEQLDISLEQHHNALADSYACAEILLHQERQFGADALRKWIKI